MASADPGRDREDADGESSEEMDGKKNVVMAPKADPKSEETSARQLMDEENFKYVPPKFDNTLPDIYRLLDSLEDDKGDLSEKRQPPSLFTRPEHSTTYQKISELKLTLEEEEMSPYLDHFDTGVRDDVVMLGSISLDEVQEEEKHLRDEHIQYLEQEAAQARDRQQELLRREEEAKKRVAKYTQLRREEIMRQEEMLRQKEKMLMDRLHQSFRRAESQLISVLERRKGEVKTFYGDLMMTEVQYGGARGRRWKVDWNRTPQPIQVKLKCLRGVKDKLPRGRYVLMVSLYDRLGGNILRWGEMKGQHWGGATLPVHHEGAFYNVEMKLDQSMFTVLPSKASLKPGMCLIFELFLLRGSVVTTDRVVGWGCFPICDAQFDIIEGNEVASKAFLKPDMCLIFELFLLRGSVVTTDRVVGWGCFPICDAQFDIIEGKYKVPFLRGEVDNKIEKHETIERLISHELDHWLCNLYFELVKLPRYLGGMKEYEVELEFSSALTSYPDRRRTGGEKYRDGEAPVLGSHSDLSSDMGSQPSLHSSEPPAYQITARTTATLSKVKLEEPDKPTSFGSRKLHKDKKLDLMLMEDSDPEDSDPEDVKAMKSEGEFRKVKRMAGMYYKKYEKNPMDMYHDKLFTILPKTAITEPTYKNVTLTHLEELEKHSFSVQPPLAEMGRVKKHGHERMEYVGRQFLSELGLSQWRGREFWGMLFMLILTFFFRIFIHYPGQWIFLSAIKIPINKGITVGIGLPIIIVYAVMTFFFRIFIHYPGQWIFPSAIKIPINKFNWLPYTVELNYQYTLLTTQQEIAVVILGPLFVLFVFLMLIAISWVFHWLFDQIPDFACKFIMAYGIMTVLDPLLILAVDCILERYKDDSITPTADFAKLWYHFLRIEGSGLAGVFITCFLYGGFMFIAGAFLYMYFLRLHNNGRLLDCYWRLRDKEENFFVPYDLELSNQELHYIVSRAEAWRGEEGERRKIAVYDYIWEEEDLEDTIWQETTLEEDDKKRKTSNKEITTHVSIHTIHLDGLRELYRQFLRLPDGAVVEVFGDVAIPGMDKDIKDAMNKGTEGLEKMMGSQTSLRERGVRGRERVHTSSGFRTAQPPPSPPSPAMSSDGSSSLPKKKSW